MVIWCLARTAHAGIDLNSLLLIGQLIFGRVEVENRGVGTLRQEKIPAVETKIKYEKRGLDKPADAIEDLRVQICGSEGIWGDIAIFP